VYATAALTQAFGTAMKAASKAVKAPIYIAGELRNDIVTTRKHQECECACAGAWVVN
jgi:hypothetical protein